jgi:hypothetical protein
MVPRRSFLVEAHVGRRIASVPFGRFDVGDEGLVVRAWLIPRFQPLSVRKESIIEISIYNRLGICRLKVEDAEAIFSRVSLALPTKVNSIIGELQRRGYPVVDLRKRTRQNHG